MSIANQRRVTQAVTDTITDYFTEVISRDTQTYIKFELSKQGKGREIKNIPVRVKHILVKKLKTLHFASFLFGKEQGIRNIEKNKSPISFLLNTDTSTFAEFIRNEDEQRRLRTNSRIVPPPKRVGKFGTSPDYYRSSSEIIKRDINHKLNVLETFKELELKEGKAPYTTFKSNVDINYTKFGKTYLDKRQHFLAEVWNRDLTESTKKSISSFNNRYKAKGNYGNAVEEVINDLYNSADLKRDTAFQTLSKGVPSKRDIDIRGRFIRRIRKIVITETNAMYNLGILDEYLRRGYTRVRWTAGYLEYGRVKTPVKLKVEDIQKHKTTTPKGLRTGVLSDKTCHFCIGMDGKIFNILDLMSPKFAFTGKSFPTPVEGKMSQGLLSQIGNKIPMIPAHPYCGCFWIPISDDVKGGTTGAVSIDKQPDIDSKKFGAALFGGIASTVLLYAAYRAFRPSLRSISTDVLNTVQEFGKSNQETIKSAYSEVQKVYEQVNEGVESGVNKDIEPKTTESETPVVQTLTEVPNVKELTEQVNQETEKESKAFKTGIRVNNLEQAINYKELAEGYIIKSRKASQLRNEIDSLLTLPEIDVTTIQLKLGEYKEATRNLVNEVSDINRSMDTFGISINEMERTIREKTERVAGHLPLDVKKQVVEETDTLKLVNDFKRTRDAFKDDRGLINKDYIESITSVESALIKRNVLPFNKGQLRNTNNAIISKIKGKKIPETLDLLTDSLEAATRELSSYNNLDDLVYRTSKSLNTPIQRYRKGFKINVQIRDINNFRNNEINLKNVQNNVTELFIRQGELDGIFTKLDNGKYLLKESVNNAEWLNYINRFENIKFKPLYSRRAKDLGYKETFKSSQRIYKRAKNTYRNQRRQLEELYDTIGQEFNLSGDRDVILEYLKIFDRRRFTRDMVDELGSERFKRLKTLRDKIYNIEYKMGILYNRLETYKKF
jgi:hypothetical protein